MEGMEKFLNFYQNIFLSIEVNFNYNNRNSAKLILDYLESLDFRNFYLLTDAEPPNKLIKFDMKNILLDQIEKLRTCEIYCKK